MEDLLHGVRVLDVATFSPVRFGTTVLADLGAEVIQIERPVSAQAADMALLSSTEHPRWLWHSRNKRSVGLDLKHHEGLAVFYQLVDTADIVVEGFAVGVARRLSIDYDTIRVRKPDIVYASVSGFGQRGPNAGVGGHEQNYQAMSGLTAASAGPGRDPALTPLPISDSVSSLYAVVGVLAALQRRRVTGRGAFIDISIQDSVLSLFGYNAQYHWQQGVQDSREVAEFGGHPGTGVYPTADGRWLVLSAVEPWVWSKLCRFLGLEHLIDRFAAVGAEAQDVRAELSRTLASRSRDEWEHLNSQHDLGLTPVLDYTELLRDPHVLGHGMVDTVAHATLGEVRQLATPIAVDGHVPSADWLPQLAEQTDTVLTELGYRPDRIAALRATGAAH
jgi:crotonobetainyl-CoA:carnitine CoA-transferase CaiB-like acyl-CoA transferase